MHSIDGALQNLNAAINQLERVKCTLDMQEAGGRGTFVRIRPAGAPEREYFFGGVKVFHQYAVTITLQDKNTQTNKASEEVRRIRAKIEEDRKRGGFAQTTFIVDESPGDDIGRDKMEINLTVQIDTKEFDGC